ncbi:heterokaryon incompatibility protein-domain-containing protein [Suillus ampliporus]|nr:heterokaryon incompatibility protein-domain-containing protein [Suillus ampliporus]
MPRRNTSGRPHRTVMDQATKDRLNEFDQYVMNDIPIHLIRISDMTLVSRDDVREHFRARFLQSSKKKDPEEIVKYATLSHRWGEGESAYGTFEEMKEAKLKTPGFKKLKTFCEKVKEYDVEFAWSDTCCIDKSSSAELDESIRSMFKWYRNSDVCIVHLAQSETVKDILDDEWTERGWTLQELLAPNHIKFFNKHWKPMTRHDNDKDPDTGSATSDVLKTLTKATGVPQSEIRDFDPEAFKVDERMKWAAKRKTTRVEDAAYSLMGIFDVSLQIAYGEGGDRAFGRLIEAIMLAGDPSVLNWKGEAAESPNSHAIPRSPQCFVGDRNLDLTYERLEMTMTSLGLRVPLVIFPLDLCSTGSTGDNGTRFTLKCSLCPTIKIHITVDEDEFEKPQTQYAIGVVNYSLIRDGSHEAITIRGKSAGFVLYKTTEDDPPPRPSQPTNCVGLEFVPPPQSNLSEYWLSVDGGMVVFNFPDIKSNDVFYISRKYLETVYL